MINNKKNAEKTFDFEQRIEIIRLEKNHHLFKTLPSSGKKYFTLLSGKIIHFFFVQFNNYFCLFPIKIQNSN